MNRARALRDTTRRPLRHLHQRAPRTRRVHHLSNQHSKTYSSSFGRSCHVSCDSRNPAVAPYLLRMDVLALLGRALSDRYDVDRQIGAGGMALVFRARDRKHDRFVAIKVLQPELAASIGTQRFLQEITFAAGLQHPNLLPVYDSGEAEGQLYYVMPFIEGESLADRLAAQGPLPLPDIVSVTRDTASALTFAHSRDVVHRDIKPDNILLTGSRAIVADLGIARALGEAASGRLTATGVAVGTAYYMSPEQALGDASLGARSDQYSLACVVFEMLTGEQPFRAPSLPAILAKVISGPRPLASEKRAGLNASIDAVVSRGLAADPADRFESCDAFAVALEDAAHQRTQRTAIAVPRGRRNMLLVLLGAAVVATGAAGVRALRERRVKSGTHPDAPQSERIAVVPFTIGSHTNTLLSEGIIDLVATNLQDLDGISVIPARDVLKLLTKSAPVDLEPGAAAALGATTVVSGSLIGTGTRTRLIALIARPDGAALQRVQFEVADSATLTLVDSLSVAIIRVAWRGRDAAPALRSVALTSASLPAVHAYLAGEQAARRGDWSTAMGQFEHAIQLDSAFALAYASLATASGWVDGEATPEALRMLERGSRYAHQLSAQDRRRFNVHLLFTRGVPECVDSAQAFSAAYPGDVDGWLMLGESLYHSREIVPVTADEIVAPFDSVIAHDPNYLPAYQHPMEIMTEVGNALALARYVNAYAAHAAPAAADRARRVLHAVAGPPDSLGGALALVQHDAALGFYLSLLAAPARRSPEHYQAAVAAMRRGVATAADDAAVRQNYFSLALYFLGTGLPDSALQVVRDLERIEKTDGIRFTIVSAASSADPADARFGTMVDSTLLRYKDRHVPPLELNRARRALSLRDTARVRALVTPLLTDSTAAVAGQAEALLGSVALLAHDTVTGRRLLEHGIRRSGIRANIGGRLRFDRAMLLMAQKGVDRERGRALLTTGFLNDFEFLGAVRRALRLPADSAWQRVVDARLPRAFAQP